MGWTDLWLRIRALARRRRAERDLDEEMNFHLEMEARKNRLADLSDAEARRAARVEFGGLEQEREECRDARGVAFLQNLARDLRIRVRCPDGTAMTRSAIIDFTSKCSRA